MACLILSFGSEFAFAFSTAAAKEALLSGFGSPPVFAATVIFFESFENSADLFLSCAALRCFVVAHFECPDIFAPLSIFSRVILPQRLALKLKN